MPFADESVKTAVEYRQQYSLGYAYYGAGVLWLIKGDYNEAVDVLERGLDLRNFRFPRTLPVSRFSPRHRLCISGSG